MGKLILVATPIGNLDDISKRACETLAQADLIAAEDTRHSGLLLQHLGIKKPLLSYYKHNEKSRADQILAVLDEGKSVAVISDAGTPGIADPGSDIAQQAIAAGHEVTAIPGACALVMALVLSGLPTDRFVFEAFLPRGNEGVARLRSLQDEQRTMVFYESPHRLTETLAAMREIFGDSRQAAICRELSKFYEEINRDTLANLERMWSERKIQGEFVLVVQGAEAVAAELDEQALNAELARLLAGGMKKRAAAKELAIRYNLAVNEVYSRILAAEETD